MPIQVDPGISRIGTLIDALAAAIAQWIDDDELPLEPVVAATRTPVATIDDTTRILVGPGSVRTDAPTRKRLPEREIGVVLWVTRQLQPVEDQTVVDQQDELLELVEVLTDKICGLARVDTSDDSTSWILQEIGDGGDAEPLNQNAAEHRNEFSAAIELRFLEVRE